MKEKIIQFGEGNFLRGFVDYFIHKLNEKQLFNGSVVVVQPIENGTIDLINQQNGKYNLYLRGIDNGEVKTEHTLIESISRGINPYKSFDDYIALADNPDFKFIISNTTESGIVFDDKCKFNDCPASSYPGKLTQLLYKRFCAGLDGFIILACELIDNNGDELKKCVLNYADLWGLGDKFIEWLETNNTFSNTLVDRIVTGFPKDEAQTLNPEDKLLDTAEIFHLWVIGGNFENELPLQKAGFNVEWTDDVTPYKKRKVRILNGSHTSIVLGALLAGLNTVGECMDDKTVYAYLKKCLFDEILPTIGATEDNEKFAQSVLDRFKNPFIKHQLRSIALNSVSKFSVRVLPTILEFKEQTGVYPKALTMSLAMLIEFYKQDEPSDAQEVIDYIKANDLKQILSNQDLWKTNLSDMYDEISDDLVKINELGTKGAMEWIISK